ncbi:MAG TPA: glycosyltransferase family 1 protein [Methanotrichaceae archaeon]|nr:glycosyltransferase family 1 protein [Methanotrichaceae archaeon]
MRVVIDMQGAQTSFSKNRGVGRYTIELAKAIALNPRGHEIILALNGAFPDTIEAIRAEFEDILPPENIKVWQQFFDTAIINLKNTWRKKAGDILREEFLNSLKGDIIFSTNLQEGLFDAACTSIKILPTDSIICATIHDVTPLVYPQRYLTDSIIRSWYEEKIEFIKKSDAVITVSQSSKREISELLGIPLEKIYSIHNAVNHEKFRPKNIGPDDKKALLARLNISGPFVMYVGGSDAHKNLDALYTAFSKLPKEILRSHKLVMVGRGLKEDTNHHNILKRPGIGSNVIFTGHVDDDELVMLYNLADLFVFPSIHEGFGLPPLEAMACGAAVLASNASSLPEVIGLKEALFDPYDDIDIAKKIERALTDGSFRSQLKEHGIEQASTFSWEKSAGSLLTVFEEIVRNNDAINSSVQPSLEHDSVQSITSHVAAMRPSPPFDDKDLVALSASIAETFCTRKDHRPKLFLDVSSVIKQDDLSGIQRVVRAICKELITNQQKIDIELVYTTTGDLEFYRADALINKILGRSGETAGNEWMELCPGDMLLYLDLHPGVAISHKKKTQFMRNKGIRVYHVVYDILPILDPESFWPDLCSEFKEWLLTVSTSDGAVCISHAVADELAKWLKANGQKRLRPFKIGWFHLGADVENSVPTRGLPHDFHQVLSQLSARPSFLMVGTIEPRKGHAQTLAAFEKLWADGCDANLVIVGRKGWGMDELAKTMRHHPEHGRRLFWLEGISDEYLEKVYAASTCLIASSYGEGFGLPLIEAAQHKLPIIARALPVFREVAGDHAFYFNGREPADLARAVMEWLALYQSGRHPRSEGMPWLTWKQSSQQLMDLMLQDKWQYR